MRKSLIVVAVLLFSMPLLAGTKTTVQQLDDLLADLHKQSKSDDAVAAKLKDVELTEQLTSSKMNSFSQYQPGPSTVEQIHILAVESALMPPPAGDLPTAAPPDMATQKAIVGRAVEYVSKQVTHLPRFTAEKVTARFQNGLDYVPVGSLTGSSMGNADLGFGPSHQYLRLLGQHTSTIVSESGIELPPAKPKRGDPGGQNGQISQGGPGPVLSVILLDAAKGSITWGRWETVDGKQVAVFAFAVNRKQSHYQVNYCCFPQIENVGSHIGASPSASQGTTGPTGDNYGTNTSFAPFKTTAGYHGEFFIDPDTGTIVRLITQAISSQAIMSGKKTFASTTRRWRSAESPMCFQSSP